MFEEDRTGLDRSYIALPVSPEDAAVMAMRWALPRANDEWAGVGLRVSRRRDLDHGSVLQELERGGVRVSTDRRGSSSGQRVKGPLIAYCPDLRSLAAIEDRRSRATAIVVAGADGSLRPWVSAFNPEHLGGEVIEPLEPAHPVVWQAMKTFTVSVNSSTALTDPRDRSRVIDGLTKLQRAGYLLDPDKLMAAALRLNWRGEAAWDLRGLAEGITAGKQKRIRERYRADIVPMWEQEANE